MVRKFYFSFIFCTARWTCAYCSRPTLSCLKRDHTAGEFERCSVGGGRPSEILPFSMSRNSFLKLKFVAPHQLYAPPLNVARPTSGLQLFAIISVPVPVSSLSLQVFPSPFLLPCQCLSCLNMRLSFLSTPVVEDICGSTGCLLSRLGSPPTRLAF